MLLARKAEEMSKKSNTFSSIWLSSWEPFQYKETQRSCIFRSGKMRFSILRTEGIYLNTLNILALSSLMC